jgi:hypothetical protein
MIVCSRNEAISELVASYHTSLLSVSKNHEGSEENNSENVVEDWEKLISDPVMKFPDFMNADETTMTTATITMEEIYKYQSVKSGNGEESGSND